MFTTTVVLGMLGMGHVNKILSKKAEIDVNANDTKSRSRKLVDQDIAHVLKNGIDTDIRFVFDGSYNPIHYDKYSRPTEARKQKTMYNNIAAALISRENEANYIVKSMDGFVPPSDNRQALVIGAAQLDPSKYTNSYDFPGSTVAMQMYNKDRSAVNYLGRNYAFEGKSGRDGRTPVVVNYHDLPFRPQPGF